MVHPQTDWWFCRHGESTANAGGWLSGWDDVPLTSLGEAQARARAEAAAALPFRRCLTSDLGRARDTARHLLSLRPDVVVHVEPALRERNMGELQGFPVSALRPGSAERRTLRTWDQAPPGAETPAVLVARALAALRRWDDGTPTLVVAHGALVRNVLGVIDGRNPQEFLEEAAADHVVLHARRVDLRTVVPPPARGGLGKL